MVELGIRSLKLETASDHRWHPIRLTMKKHNEIIYLEDRLWAKDGLLSRSEELTPLYIERYRGSRMNPSITDHDFWEISCVVSGSGTLRTPTTEQQLEAATIYLIPPKIEHCELTAKILDTIWIGLHGHRLPRSTDEVMILRNESLAKKIIRLWRAGEHRHGMVGSELDGMTAVIMGQFFRLLGQHKNSESHSIQNIIKYLQDNFSEQIYFNDLATKAGYSEGHFYRSFKQLTGETPSHFLTAIRIRHACNLLNHTNFSLAEIATLSGFNDPFYFSRTFKKWLSTSPSQFREKTTQK